MKTTRILAWSVSGRNTKRMIDLVVAALRQGELVVLPTDTVYGLAADPRVPGAEQRLARAKRRRGDKPIPLLAADCRQVEDFPAELGAGGRTLAARYWPGALTLVLKTGRTWEGFRVPNHPAALAILKAVGGVLRVTSANLSGAAPALSAAAAVKALGEIVALAVNAPPPPSGVPSTVVKIGPKRCQVLREGAIPGAEIIATVRSAEGSHGAA